MLPNKLQHGDTLDSLLQKYNEMVDYLRETRLVAGPGMRINRHPAGTTIESTATATGAAPAAPSDNTHPFDMELINRGSDENPDYYVRIFNSALPDSPYAGVAHVGSYTINVPVVEIPVTTDDFFYVSFVVSYNGAIRPAPFDIYFEAFPTRYYPPDSSTTYRKIIASGKLPNEIRSNQTAMIEVIGRWV